MKVSRYISQRLRLGRGSGSPAATIIAVAGVALTVMVMEFSLAIVVGFKSGIRNKLAGFDAQVSILAPLSADSQEEQQAFTLTPSVSRSVADLVPGDADVRLSIRRPGMLKTDSAFLGALYIGQSPDADFTFERANITQGEWPDFSADSTRNHIVLSEPMAAALGLGPGDKVYSAFIVNEAVKLRRHTVAALYRSDFGEYDQTVVYASLQGLQSVAGLDSTSADRLEIRGLAEENIDPVATSLQNRLLAEAALSHDGQYYPVDDIHRSGALYYNWLALLDTNVVVILALMMAVAAFTLVSSLFILILERVPMIGVLRALGASQTMIRRIFSDLGMRLVGMGMLLGNIIAISLLLIQQHWHVLPLDPQMYYLSSVPVQINVTMFVLLNIGVGLASWLILMIPARTAARTDPAKAISAD